MVMRSWSQPRGVGAQLHSGCQVLKCEKLDSLRVISRWAPGIRQGLCRLQKRITMSASQLIYKHSSFGAGNLFRSLFIYIKCKLHPMEKLSETKSSVAGHPEETEVLPHLSYVAHGDIHRWGIFVVTSCWCLG